MSLDYAILGFLAGRAMTGYDLKKLFDTSVSHFWPADQSQIYRTLTGLAERGWVTQEVIAQNDRPDRKVYHITPEGRANLRQWLMKELPVAPTRSASMIQVFFSAQLQDEDVIVMLERVAAHMRAGLAMYDDIPRQIENYREYTQSPREFFFWMLTLDIGQMTMRANLDWIEQTIRRIRNGEVPPS